MAIIKSTKSKFDSAIGLDIGRYSIKCVEMGRSQDKFKLEKVTILPISGESPEAVKKALKFIFDQNPAANKKVRISVSSGASLLIRRIQLPAMTATELKGAIRFEAESHIPFPIDECLLDFQIINKTADQKSVNVLLVAAKKDFIQERLKLMSSVSIVPEIIDVDIFCLINAYETLAQETKEESFGILNMGHGVSSFAIISNKQPYFVREISYGAQGINKALAQSRGVTEENADRIKIEKLPDTLGEIKIAAQKGLEPLIEEMRHSIDFFENEAGEELKSIWLSGGGALCHGVPEELSSELGRKVALWDNTQKIQIFGDVDQAYLKEHSPELNVALGMVLRGAGAKK